MATLTRPPRASCSPSWIDGSRCPTHGLIPGYTPPFANLRPGLIGQRAGKSTADIPTMLHPATRLYLWCLILVLTQRAEGAVALGLALAFSAAALLGARPLFWRLVKRARYLLVAIAVVFAWCTPGFLLVGSVGFASPTAEGVALAVTHVCRLVCVLSLVSFLLTYTPVPKLVAGLYSLAQPLGWVGVDRGRAAVRLELVLRYCSGPKAERDWRAWLAEPAPKESGVVCVGAEAFRLSDVLALGLACLLVVAGWAWS